VPDSAAIRIIATFWQPGRAFKTRIDKTKIETHARGVMQDIFVCSRSSSDVISGQSQLGASMIASISIESCKVNAEEFSAIGICLLLDLARAEQTIAKDRPWMVSEILKFFEPMRRVFEKRKLVDHADRRPDPARCECLRE
jgi:hypothetical protein